MSVTMIAILLLIGLFLIIVEVLITPGIIVGSLGVLFMGFGIYQTYVGYGMVIGNWTLFGMFVLSIAVVVGALRSKAWKRMSLEHTLDGKVNVIDLDKIKPGDEGKTLSALRPSGNAIIHGSRVEVTTIGESLDAHTEIIVKEISQNKIIVKAK